MPAMATSKWLVAALWLVQDALAQQQHGSMNGTKAMNGTSHGNMTSAGGHGSRAANGTRPGGSKHITSTVADPPDTVLNRKIARNLIYTWVGLIVFLTLYASVIKYQRHQRKLACMDRENGKQVYFNRPSPVSSLWKKHIVDAPFFRKRHHRELMVSPKINMGALPNRSQAIFIFAYVLTMLVLTFVRIDYSRPERYWHSYLMKRTGSLAIINLLPLFLLAGRNNPLIRMCGITFDTFNYIHRWIGRVVIFEGLTHAITYLTKKAHGKGGIWTVRTALKTAFVREGMTAAIAVTLILLTTPVPFRRAFYETFLHIHQALAIILLVALWFHTGEYSIHRATIGAAIAFWAAERLVRLVRIYIHSIGNGGAKADIRMLPGGAVEVKVRLARPWKFTPGQHAFIYLPRIGLHMNHPFSVIWAENSHDNQLGRNRGIESIDAKEAEARAEAADVEGDAMSKSNSNAPSEVEKELEKQDTAVAVPTTTNSAVPQKVEDTNAIVFKSRGNDPWERPQDTIHFIVRPKGGFTGKLAAAAQSAPSGVLSTRCFIEGPYNEQKLHSYGTVVLFAAGVGITHSFPHVRDLVQGYNDGTVAARKVTLIWALMNADCLEWIRTWMDEILALPRRTEVLKVVLYIFSGMDDREIWAPSPGVEVYRGIPNSEALLDAEVVDSVGAIGVSVCGIGAMADDVRFACRKWMDKVNIELEEESFSW